MSAGPEVSAAGLLVYWLAVWTPTAVICALLERRARRNRPLPPPEDPRRVNAEAERQWRARVAHSERHALLERQWH